MMFRRGLLHHWRLKQSHWQSLRNLCLAKVPDLPALAIAHFFGYEVRRQDQSNWFRWLLGQSLVDHGDSIVQVLVPKPTHFGQICPGHNRHWRTGSCRVCCQELQGCAGQMVTHIAWRCLNVILKNIKSVHVHTAKCTWSGNTWQKHQLFFVNTRPLESNKHANSPGQLQRTARSQGQLGVERTSPCSDLPRMLQCCSRTSCVWSCEVAQSEWSFQMLGTFEQSANSHVLVAECRVTMLLCAHLRSAHWVLRLHRLGRLKVLPLPPFGSQSTGWNHKHESQDPWQ